MLYTHSVTSKSVCFDKNRKADWPGAPLLWATLNMLISLRSTKGIYPSAPVVNKNHCQKKMDADAFSQLLQLQFFQFAQVAEQFLVKSVTQPFSISKTEK